MIFGGLAARLTGVPRIFAMIEGIGLLPSRAGMSRASPSSPLAPYLDEPARRILGAYS